MPHWIVLDLLALVCATRIGAAYDLGKGQVLAACGARRAGAYPEIVMVRRIVSAGVALALLATSAWSIARAQSTADTMTYHGGPVIGVSTTYAIYWLPPGAHFEATGDDARYESLIGRFLADIGGSGYYDVLTQYSTDSGGRTVENGPILNSSTFGGSWIDTNTMPHAGTTSDPLEASDLLAEVQRALAANGWTAGIDHIYAVFTPQNVNVCDFPRTSADASSRPGRECTVGGSIRTCGENWHDSANGQPLVYIMAPSTSTAGCSLDRNDQPPDGDVAADSEIMQLARYLASAVTDPLGDAWFHGTGPASGDVSAPCLTTTLTEPLPMNGHTYISTSLWSNAENRCTFADPPPRVMAHLQARRIKAGAKQTLFVTTKPGSIVGLVITYSNYTVDYPHGKTNASGTFRYTWKPRKIKGPVTVRMNVFSPDFALRQTGRTFRIW